MAVAAGKLITIQDADYVYGTGDLRLRAKRVDRTNPVTYLGEIWFRVEGVQLTASGAEIGRPRP
jgi:hypothetical protein